MAKMAAAANAKAGQRAMMRRRWIALIRATIRSAKAIARIRSARMSRTVLQRWQAVAA
jgi:hypothetical protein